MTIEEYFGLPETMQPIELINGEVIVRPTPSPKHQLVLGDFLFLLDKLIPDGELLPAPVDVYLDDKHVIQPEILWVSANSRCKIGRLRLEGPPDLVVEVLSPGLELHDRKTKFNLYERFGVREYWMADAEEQFLEVHRHENGVFVRQGVYGPDESFVSVVLGGKTVELKGVFVSEK
jgi:Uma2 family endonuclease